MRIQHNIMAMNAYRNYTNNTSAVAKNLEKLSSGLPRSTADPATMPPVWRISEKDEALQITGLSAAKKNVKDRPSPCVRRAEAPPGVITTCLQPHGVAPPSSPANGKPIRRGDREAIHQTSLGSSSPRSTVSPRSNFNGISCWTAPLDDRPL